MVKKIKTSKQDRDLAGQLNQLKDQLAQAQEKEVRAVADYQNLIRRNQEDRAGFVKYATADLIEDLLQPLEHLSLAASQLDDQGLNMVIEKLWQTLSDHGLEEIDPQGQEFDVQTMEAVEQGGQASPLEGRAINQEQAKVTQVMSKGYKLNGKVLKFAKVVVG